MKTLSFKKVTALSVALMFTLTQGTFLDLANAQSPLTSTISPVNLNKLEMPAAMASLEERFVSPKGAQGMTVIAIQDAHGIFDAQKNIKSIIQVLQDQNGFELVGLEGGQGRADHTLLRTFPNKEINEAQTHKYMKRAELSGGEAAAILNPKPGIFYGVEDKDLYFQNRNSFLKGMAAKDANLHTLLLLSKKLDKIRDKIFPPELLKFQKAEQKFQANQMHLLEFLPILEEFGGKNLEEKYPNVVRLFQAVAAARKKPAKEAAAEKEKELTAQIQGRVLFEEIKQLSGEIKSKLYTTPDVGSLDRLYQNVGILKSLSGLEMTREEWNTFQSDRKSFEFSQFTDFLEKYDDSIDLALNLLPAEEFYKDAIRRDGALYDNLLDAMKKEKKTRAILVTGGFHTNGLRERMQKDGISYMIYMPRIEHMESENPYYEVMEGKVSYRNSNRSSIQVVLATMGLDPKLSDEFNEAYAEGGLTAVVKQAAARSNIEIVPELNQIGAAWRNAIIKAEKEQGELKDPSSLINLTQKFVKEIAERVPGESKETSVRQMLAVLKDIFVSTMGKDADHEVARFTEGLTKLLDYLKDHNESLKPIHLDILFAMNSDFEKAKPYLDLPESGVVTYADIYEAASRVPARATPVAEVLAEKGVAPKAWQGREQSITLSEAAAKGLLDPYRELAKAASLGTLTEGEKFWKYKRLNPDKIAEIRKLYFEYQKVKADMEKKNDEIGDVKDRALALIKERKIDPRSFKTISIMSYGRPGSGAVVVDLGYEVPTKGLSTQDRANLMMENLKEHDVFTEIREKTGVNYWKTLYELEEKRNHLLSQIQSLQAFPVDFIRRPDVSSKNYLRDIETELLEEALPGNHFFKVVMGAHFDDYSATQEKTVLSFLDGYGIDMSDLSGIEDKEDRKRLILQRLEPLILKSDGMPRMVSWVFRWTITTYIFRAGTKLIPIEGNIENIPAEKFLQKLKLRMGDLGDIAQFNRPEDKILPQPDSQKSIKELRETFMEELKSPVSQKDKLAGRDMFVMTEILLRGKMGAYRIFQYLRNDLPGNMDIAKMTGEGLVRMLVEAGAMDLHPDSKVEEARGASLGRWDEGIGQLERKLQSEPGTQGVRSKLIAAYIAKGRLDDAARVIRDSGSLNFTTAPGSALRDLFMNYVREVHRVIMQENGDLNLLIEALPLIGDSRLSELDEAEVIGLRDKIISTSEFDDWHHGYEQGILESEEVQKAMEPIFQAHGWRKNDRGKIQITKQTLELYVSLNQFPNTVTDEVMNEELRNLSGLGNLRTLVLESMQLNDEGFSHISNLENLTSLNLDFPSQINNEAIYKLFRNPDPQKQNQIRHPAWIDLMVLFRDGSFIYWEGTPENGRPVRASSLGSEAAKEKGPDAEIRRLQGELSLAPADERIRSGLVSALILAGRTFDAGEVLRAGGLTTIGPGTDNLAVNAFQEYFAAVQEILSANSPKNEGVENLLVQALQLVAQLTRQDTLETRISTIQQSLTRLPNVRAWLQQYAARMRRRGQEFLGNLAFDRFMTYHDSLNISLVLQGRSITDQQLSRIGVSFPNLWELDLADTRVTNLSPLIDSEGLVSINVARTQVSDDNVRALFSDPEHPYQLRHPQWTTLRVILRDGRNEMLWEGTPTNGRPVIRAAYLPPSVQGASLGVQTKIDLPIWQGPDMPSNPYVYQVARFIRSADSLRGKGVGAKEIAGAIPEKEINEFEKFLGDALENPSILDEVKPDIHQVLVAVRQRVYDWRNKGPLSFDLALKGYAVEVPFNIGTLQSKLPNFVRSVAISPDGKKVVAGGNDGIARIWEMGKGQEQSLALKGHEGAVMSVAFSPDGEYIATASRDMTVLWDPFSGQKIRDFIEEDGGRVTFITFSPDGKLLLTRNENGIARLWDVQTGFEIRSFKADKGHLTSISFTPDGNELLIGNEYGEVKQVNVTTGEERGGSRFVKPDAGWMSNYFLIMDENGKPLLVSKGDSTVYLHDLTTGERVRKFQHPEWIHGMAFSPDRKLMLTAGYGGFILIWDVARGEIVRELRGTNDEIHSAAFSADGTMVITGGKEGSVHVWQAPRLGTRLPSVREIPITETVKDGGKTNLQMLRMTPDGKKALILKKGEIRIFDIEQGEEKSLPVSGARKFDITSDGSVLLEQWDRNTGKHNLKIWNLEKGQEIADLGELPQRESVRSNMAVSPDGKKAMMGYNDGTVMLWDLEGKKAPVDLGRFGNDIDYMQYSSHVAFLPNTGDVLIVGTDRSFFRMNLETRENVPIGDQELFKRDGMDIDHIATSPDGTLAVTFLRIGMGIVWDTKTGKQLSVLRGHKPWVHDVTFNPDGRRIISTGQDGTIRIWDAQTGREISRLAQDLDPLSAIAITPDGSRIIAALQFGNMFIYEGMQGNALSRVQGLSEKHLGELQTILNNFKNNKEIVRELDSKISDWQRRFREFSLLDPEEAITVDVKDLTADVAREMKKTISVPAEIAISDQELVTLVTFWATEHPDLFPSAHASSLGAATAPGPLETNQLNFLAFRLGFGTFDGDEDETKKQLAGIITGTNIPAIQKQLAAHIRANLSKYFEDQEAGLKILAESAQRMNPSALENQVANKVSKLLDESPFVNLDKKIKAKADRRLTQIFTGVLRGIPRDVREAEILAQEKGSEAAETKYLATLQTPEQKIDMEAAKAGIGAGMDAVLPSFKESKNKTLAVAEIESMPVDLDQTRAMISRAFRSVPVDFLGRPLLGFTIYYTERDKDRAAALKQYLEELRKEKSPFASLITLKQVTEKALPDELKRHQKALKKDENLIFLVPDIKLLANTREANVISHRDSDIPENLSFVKETLSEAAVRLPYALKLKRENNSEGQKFLDHLKDNLGITYYQDPSTQQIIISIDLQKFIDKLVKAQEAARQARVSA